MGLPRGWPRGRLSLASHFRLPARPPSKQPRSGATHPAPLSVLSHREDAMSQDDHLGPEEGTYVTFLLVVSDQDRSRNFYQSVFGGKVLRERDPGSLVGASTRVFLNTGGGPTGDKPTGTPTTPSDPDRVSAFLNIRVADIRKAYEAWAARGGEFLTEPKDHGYEIRAYIRDPDGHLIEVGQTTPR